MSWLTNFVRPKIQALIRKPETPENLWSKCPGCEHMLFHRDLEESQQVCHYCNYHLRVTVKKRLELLFDNKQYQLINTPKVIADPIKFKDLKKYNERLKEYRQKTKHEDSVLIASGKIIDNQAIVLAYDFNFMGGSMGLYAGQAMVSACNAAINTNSPLIAVTASGGARMQEGILSLMQMPRTTIAVQELKEAGLPYIVLLTDPTTGGVSASFAMLGDIAIAEPGAVIGFAGARVIEETIRQKLPAGFQKAEYLYEHGMVDMVINRKDLPQTIGKILSLLMKDKHR